MNLTSEDKELILDFYFRCGEQEHIDAGRDLIASSPEAAELYASLEDTLTQLDSIKYEPCPDNLAELTIARLKLAASASQVKLEGLLAEEQKKSEGQRRVVTRAHSFRRAVRITAAAAMIVVGVGIFSLYTLNMRQREWQQMCAAGLGRVGKGMLSYVKDNDGRLPAVAMAQGAPWWKVGDQGQKNQSNTRGIWLLVKYGYVDAKDFVCPGRKDGKVLNCSAEELEKYNDFPSRQNIGYSFILLTKGVMRRQRAGKAIVLLADSNPVFEKVFDGDTFNWENRDEFSKISLSRRMRRIMSRNHRRRGQNVLLGGGSAEFKDKRVILNDDIYTVRGVNDYRGCETPLSDDDFFLVP